MSEPERTEQERIEEQPTWIPRRLWPLLPASEFATTFDERWMRESLAADRVKGRAE